MLVLLFKKAPLLVYPQWSMWERGDEVCAAERRYYMFKTFDPSMRK